jgi:hypothetical protein
MCDFSRIGTPQMPQTQMFGQQPRQQPPMFGQQSQYPGGMGSLGNPSVAPQAYANPMVTRAGIGVAPHGTSTAQTV